jgi:hypothetical protein
MLTIKPGNVQQIRQAPHLSEAFAAAPASCSGPGQSRGRRSGKRRASLERIARLQSSSSTLDGAPVNV